MAQSNKPELTHRRLIEQLRYDPETGEFTWAKTWYGHVEGSRAGYTRKDGYLVIILDGRHLLGHRVAWLYMTGEQPSAYIDHIDGNAENNRFSNLRQATHQENLSNVKPSSKNTSGFAGVYLRKKYGTWVAEVRVGYEKVYLGSYRTAQEAAIVREEFCRLVRGEFHRPAEHKEEDMRMTQQQYDRLRRKYLQYLVEHDKADKDDVAELTELEKRSTHMQVEQVEVHA